MNAITSATENVAGIISENNGMIGKVGTWSPGGEIRFEVRVVAARANFGRVDLTVEPMAGVGRMKISAEKFSEKVGA